MHSPWELFSCSLVLAMCSGFRRVLWYSTYRHVMFSDLPLPSISLLCTFPMISHPSLSRLGWTICVSAISVCDSAIMQHLGFLSTWCGFPHSQEHKGQWLSVHSNTVHIILTKVLV